MDTTYSAYLRSLDPDTQAVIAKMDEHECLGHNPDDELSKSLVDMLTAAHSSIDKIAASLVDNETTAEQHVETMLLMLSYAPNAQSYWFIHQLIDTNPDVYKWIYEKVVSQKPLQMSGKLLRERILFYVSREQIVNHIFSDEVRAAVIRGLKDLKRA